jgi:predicted SprT family Zn-dependent metalloprotease
MATPRRGRRSPPELTLELEQALVRELMATWADLNRGLFGSALARPVIALSDSRRMLGRWQLHERRIDISRPLVLERRWTDVVEVLKHEMAHQYVHEVLKAEESPHGPAFRELCQRKGIDAVACGLPADPTQPPRESNRVLDRVSRLLALADSPNRHEAETAAALAQRLMLKHNIEASAERRNYGYRHIGTPKGRTSEAEHLLASILAEHFFVEAIWVPGYRPLDAKRGTVLEICGSEANLEMALYAHAFLSGTAERLWSEHKRREGVRSNRHRRSYLAGVMEGFRDRLRSEQRRSRERGLVWVGDADLKRYHRVRHPHVRTVRLRGHAEGEVRQHGRAAGRNIVLRRGIEQRGSQVRGQLPPRR